MPFDADRPAPPDGVKFGGEHGYIIAGLDVRGCCVIHELWIHEDHRRTGEGQRLVDQVRAWAEDQDATPLLVHCSPRNHVGREFYEAIGMRAVAIVYQDDLNKEKK